MTAEVKHRKWRELSEVTQAALRCKDPVFRAFLSETFIVKVKDEKEAVGIVRFICEVDSRSRLTDDRNAQAIWHNIDDDFQAWLARERQS